MKIVWWQQLLPKQNPVFYIPFKEMFKCLSLNHNQKIVVVEGIVLQLASSKLVCFTEDM